MFQSLADLVANFESGGNYAATNPGSTASGAYQFTNSTWQQYAALTPGASQYGTAASAPQSVQDAVFNTAVTQNGLGDWTCPGCDPALTSYLANNPSQANLPIFANGGTSSDVSPYMGGAGDTGTSQYPDPNGVLGGASGAQPEGPAAGAIGAANTAAAALVTPFWDLIMRSLVFILGMSILLVALVALLFQSKTVSVTLRDLAAAA